MMDEGLVGGRIVACYYYYVEASRILVATLGSALGDVDCPLYGGVEMDEKYQTCYVSELGFEEHLGLKSQKVQIVFYGLQKGRSHSSI